MGEVVYSKSTAFHHRRRVLLLMLGLTRLFALPLVLVTAACSSGLEISQEWDDTADFSTFQTYDWLPETEPRSADLQRTAPEVTGAVESVLAAKGLRAQESQPDLYVTWDAAVEGKKELRTYGTAYGTAYRSRYGRFPPDETRTAVVEWEEGSLIIDLIDRKRDQLVFRGSAQAKLDENRTSEEQTELIKQAVAQIFDKFPPENN